MKSDLKGMANRLRIARKRKGLTMIELAQKAGVSVQGISNVENGRSTATIWLMANICDALDVPLQWMVYGGES